MFYASNIVNPCEATYLDVPGVTVFPDGHGVSRSSDFIMYSVEAEFIDRVVAQYGPCSSPFNFSSEAFI